MKRPSCWLPAFPTSRSKPGHGWKYCVADWLKRRGKKPRIRGSNQSATRSSMRLPPRRVKKWPDTTRLRERTTTEPLSGRGTRIRSSLLELPARFWAATIGTGNWHGSCEPSAVRRAHSATFRSPHPVALHDPTGNPGVYSREGSQSRRSAVHGFPRPVAALHHPGRESGRRTFRGRPRLRRLEHPRLEGDQRIRHAGQAGPGDGVHRSVLPRHDADADLQHPRSADARGLLARSAERRSQGRQLHEVNRDRGRPRTSAREVQFFVFDDVRYEQTANSAFYQVDSGEGAWNTGRDEKPNLGHKLRHAEGLLSRARRPTRCTICARR